MKSINNFLNNITMYKLVLWGLEILALVAMILALFGLVSYNPLSILASALILLVACHYANYVFAKIFHAQRNAESAYITAMILLFLLTPATGLQSALLLIIASIIAMASKYVLAIRKKHIWNPAAVSAVILGLFGSGAVVWWVATPWLALPVAVLGFLILKKLHRFPLFGAFAVVSLAIIVFTGIASFTSALLSWPVLFLGTIMLTEPSTLPPTQKLQIAYGAIVGFLFTLQFHFGPAYSTPELALILGNIFSYAVSSKDKIKLFFVERRQMSTYVYDFAFRPERRFAFTSGQYFDWTLEHENPDSRGDRRTFTIASSPSEPLVHLGIRMDMEHGSSFKKALFNLKAEESVVASDLAGDFVMPRDKTAKLTFIAGGIGVTPFRSMIHFVKDSGEKRDIVLLYSCATPLDFAYRDEFENLKQGINLKTVYVATQGDANWTGKTGYITEQMIQQEVGDYLNRDFYISGPEAMVENYEKLLAGLSVDKNKIHTDYFPGY